MQDNVILLKITKTLLTILFIIQVIFIINSNYFIKLITNLKAQAYGTRELDLIIL